jgi:outer membrane receptor for Fe3+-dicitrate
MTSVSGCPGVAALYQIDEQWSVLAGIHRGFSPLGGSAKSAEKPETSINYEMGVRYDGAWFAEIVDFIAIFRIKRRAAPIPSLAQMVRLVARLSRRGGDCGR